MRPSGAKLCLLRPRRNAKTRNVSKVSDVNVTTKTLLPSPRELRERLEKSDAAKRFVADSREAIHRIVFGDDHRLLVIVGPCSIHDLESGREFARRLAQLAKEVDDRMLLVMRVYFEKPRTTVGWKGLIMDPHLDGSEDIPRGLELARGFLREVIDAGVPTATELLDPITPQYIADLICWSAIGARTTESQTHRQMASGLSMPLGFKNATDGDVDVAINAVRAAGQPQSFLGVDLEGRSCAISTRGNPNCHAVLRGGSEGPNYDADEVARTRSLLEQSGLRPSVMIDCSHANSGKDPNRQPEVFAEIVRQAAGDPAVIGGMLESNLEPGKQSLGNDPSQLKYGVSITDACLDWATTESIIREAYATLAPRANLAPAGA